MSINRLAHLEYPTPKIALSTDKIEAHGTGIVEGSFEVRNISEGELSGRIEPTIDFLNFSSDIFRGNKVKIEYSLNLEGMIGTHKAAAIITSNGGEKTITFDVRATAPAIARDGVKIATLEHFAEFVRKSPVEGRRLFGQKDFMIWLFNMGYPSVSTYERFLDDPNKDRAVDNFLIFNGLKNKAGLVVENADTIVKIGHGESAITGGIHLRKTTWGYAEADFHVRQGASWLKLSKSRVTTADFNKENAAEVDYIIMADEIKQRETALVDVKSNCGAMQTARIQCNISGAFEARLDREIYHLEDRGKLFLHNNTGKDLMIDIYCENFIKIEAKRYFISKYAEIGFDIKFSSLKAATLAFKKQLHSTTEIHIRALTEGRVTVKKLKLKLWGKV
ncbi:MAG: DUF5717 family protein [Defluviitaleaceae bacterium]|nr:DUF5717 family protein [Defluviitaleaceae bacterium]